MATARHVPWDGSEAASRYGTSARFNCLTNPGSILRLAASGQYYPVETGHYSGLEQVLEPWAVHAQEPMPVLAAPEPQQPAAGCAAVAAAAARAAPAAAQEQKAKGRSNGVDLIKMHLEDLRDKDPKLVFIVRGINAMRSRSQDLLTAHYSKYGRVVRVMVTRSMVKVSRNSGATPGQTRLRPGSLGFIEMGSAQSVERVLAAGTEQVVAGHRIRVERFQRMHRLNDGGSESNISATSSSWLPHSALPSASSNDSELQRGRERQENSSNRSEDGSARGRERPAAVAGNGAATADAAAATPLVQMASALAEASTAFLQQAPAGSGWQMPQQEPAPPLQRQPPQPAAAAAGSVALGALTGSSLVSTLNKIVQLICHTRALAISSRQNCVEAILLSRMAQQQLQVLMGQCQQQTLALPPEAACKIARSMQDSARSLQEQYCQMSEVMAQGTQWWGTSAAVGDSVTSPAVVGAAAMAAVAPPPGLSQLIPAAVAAPAIASPGAAAAPERSQSLASQGLSMAEACRELLQQASRAAAAAAAVAPPACGFAPERAEAAPPSEGAAAPQFVQAQAAQAAQAMPPRSVATAEAVPAGKAAAAALAPQKPSSGSCAKGQAWLGKTSPLAMHLNELQEENPRCVFITRKIGTMGYQSQDILRLHYAKYGQVERVLVVSSKVKPFKASSCEKQFRPGSLGFVVMATPESVEQILALGKEQTVANCCIVVEPFEHTVQLRKGRAESVTDSTSAGDTQGSGSRSEQGSGSSGLGGSERSEGSDKSGKSSREKYEGRGSSENSKDTNSAEGGSTDSQLAEADGSESGSGTNGEANEQDQPEREEARREREEAEAEALAEQAEEAQAGQGQPEVAVLAALRMQ